MEALKPCPTCGRFYKNAPSPDPRPAAQPGVVKGLERAPEENARGGWTLPVALLEDVSSEVEGDGWDSPTLEVVQIVMLEAERRILSALAAPVSQEPVAVPFPGSIMCGCDGATCPDGCKHCNPDLQRKAIEELASQFGASPLTEGEPSEAEVERIASPSLPEDVERVVERLERHHMDRLDAEAAALIRTLSSQLAEAEAEIVAAWNAFGGQVAEDYEDTRYAADAADGNLAEQIRALTGQRDAAEAERDRLAAELERLRANVEKIAAEFDENTGYDDDLRKSVGMETVGQSAAKRIRTALASLEDRG